MANQRDGINCSVIIEAKRIIRLTGIEHSRDNCIYVINSAVHVRCYSTSVDVGIFTKLEKREMYCLAGNDSYLRSLMYGSM